MKVLDLFSGIGGFSLGLERAGMETVAFCEYDEKARQVLKKHWPNVPQYEDVRTLTKEISLFSAEDFLAKTFQSQATKQESTKVQDRVYGVSAPVCLGKLDPNTPSLKTSQLCLTEAGEIGLSEFSGKFPRSGMMRNGTVFQLQNLARTTTEIGSGLWHTPTAHNAKEGACPSEYRRDSPTLTAEAVIGAPAKMWPTPNTMDHLPQRSEEALVRQATTTRKGRKNPSNLREAVNPTAVAIYKNPTNWPASMWPTPSASDNRDRGNMSNPSLQRRLKIGKQLMLSQVVHPTSGKLNPTWVEWLMGFPEGHTDLNN